MGPSELLYKRSSEGKAAAAAAELILSPFVIPKSIWIPFKSETSTCTLFVLCVREDETPFRREKCKKKEGKISMFKNRKVVSIVLLTQKVSCVCKTISCNQSSTYCKITVIRALPLLHMQMRYCKCTVLSHQDLNEWSSISATLLHQR